MPWHRVWWLFLLLDVCEPSVRAAKGTALPVKGEQLLRSLHFAEGIPQGWQLKLSATT